MGVKGVILAAGYGTRFLPVTRVVPKELLPLVDRPAIDFLLEEFESAGIREVLVITSRRKKALEDWFDRDPELEGALEKSGKVSALARIRPRNLAVQFVRQKEMKGTGDALLLARSFAGSDPVVVAYPDDLFGEPNCTASLIDAWRTTQKSVLSVVDMSGKDVSRYGVVDGDANGDLVTVRQVVEKPAPGEEPSHWVSMGRYLYTSEFWDALAALKSGHKEGEYYPMPAMNQLAAQGKMVAKLISAPLTDTGEPLGYVKAVVEEGLGRMDIGPSLRAWLIEKLAMK
jgi:UTP--glucose-1-phosphate uridylyltransferase